MDGKATCRDNAFVERLWRGVNMRRSIRAPVTACPRRAPIARYLAFYNERRPHSTLDARSPDEACFG